MINSYVSSLNRILYLFTTEEERKKIIDIHDNIPFVNMEEVINKLNKERSIQVSDTTEYE